MDIMRPPLNRQVSPAPWLVAHHNLDLPKLIQQAHAQLQDKDIDSIVRLLSDWQIQVSGIVVAMWMLKLREQDEAARFAEDQLSASMTSSPHTNKSYCNCDPLPCTCCKPTPDWWHQYCCDVQLSAEQANARDRYHKPPATHLSTGPH